MIVGRALEADISLADHLTSRRHAQLSVHGDQVVIEDLESTNGTFVNSQKIRRAVVRPGDRILIGVTTLELQTQSQSITLPSGQAAAPRAGAAPAPVPGKTLAVTTMVDAAKLISGSVKEIPIADLLQLLNHMRKSGILMIRNASDTGKIYLREGQICGATINGSCAVEPRRTFYRLLRWQKGSFELRPAEDEPLRADISDATDSLLLEAAWQHDELIQLESQLPPFESLLALANPLPGPLRDLTQSEMDICQLVMEHRTLLGVIDHFPGTDFEAYKDLIRLIQRKYVVVS
ncbi:MAG: DUF4388 domain-containing protein [Verrucomicrobia bacterium]|nr:DUF4388 domain-containing protein [Verrucomicrobiota bacterium]